VVELDPDFDSSPPTITSRRRAKRSRGASPPLLDEPPPQTPPANDTIDDMQIDKQYLLAARQMLKNQVCFVVGCAKQYVC
jgi:hypothetical protein